MEILLGKGLGRDVSQLIIYMKEDMERYDEMLKVFEIINGGFIHIEMTISCTYFMFKFNYYMPKLNFNRIFENYTNQNSLENEVVMYFNITNGMYFIYSIIPFIYLFENYNESLKCPPYEDICHSKFMVSLMKKFEYKGQTVSIGSRVE